jgi:hypothetical protein
MKIAIVTLPLISNFGGVLQNYALQKILKDLGHEPVTIDWDVEPTRIQYFIRCVKLFVLNKGKIILPDKYTRNTRIAPFLAENINLTPRVRTFSNIDKMLPNYDAFIVGSDQIWRYSMCKREIYNVFLGFVKCNECKKIAYAASFGISEWQYPSKITNKCGKLLSTFNAISVRESSAVKLCKKHFKVNAIQVIDPTLLISADEYSKLCIKHNFEGKYLLAYVLDATEDKIDYIKKVSEAKGLKLQILSEMRNGGCTVSEWLAYFRDASYVITDSFHGTVFSIIFNHDFITLSNPKRGQDRFISLLSLFELSDRLQNSYNYSIINEDINWSKVNSIKELLKDNSLKFLKESLSDEANKKIV